MLKRYGIIAGLWFFAWPTLAMAQVPSLDSLLSGTGSGPASGRIAQLLILLTVLSVAPGLLIMITSFTRIIIALSFLRAGLGLQSTPGNMVLISLAMFMTLYVMAPTMDRAWEEAVKPLIENTIDEREALTRAAKPFKAFMVAHVREKDLVMFRDLSAGRIPAVEGGDPDLRVLIPAFIISELRRGFEIGFLIVLPFLVIDLIVATLTMSMGMMMLSPSVLSLPFKLLFFVLVDGWNIVVSGLIRSFG